jgi:hypothetical protein
VTVWKFTLALTDEQTIVIPQDAECLHVGMQDGRPCLWARVDPDSPDEEMSIRVVGTRPSR